MSEKYVDDADWATAAEQSSEDDEAQEGNVLAAEERASSPAETAAMPSDTWAGVFGMTRTTGVPAGRPSSSWAVVTPAHRETTRVPGLRCRASSGSTSGMSCGLTTMTTVSAAAAASAFVAVRTP